MHPMSCLQIKYASRYGIWLYREIIFCTSIFFSLGLCYALKP